MVKKTRTGMLFPFPFLPLIRRSSKKGLEAYVLVSIILTIVSFSVIGYVIYTANKTYDIDQELALTRSSLFAAEKLELSVLGAEVLRAKLYLRTHLISVPEAQYSSKKADVAKNLAERTVDCWWAFGSGEISENVLSSVWYKGSKDKCFVCFIITIDELKGNEGESSATISKEEFLAYLFLMPYKAKDTKKKKCTDEQKKNNDPDCIHEGMPECEAKGGTCRAAGSCFPTEVPFTQWACKSKSQCCVEQSKIITYAS
ncbi:MAG: hypothetical protein QW594_02050, partial [Candidatus Woesearchaeota archaeon]